MADVAVLATELAVNEKPLLDGFRRADAATVAYANAAQRHMQSVQASFNGVDFSTTTSRAKAESIKLIELEHQLTIARVSGEKQTVRALEEEIALLVKVRQLRSAGFSAGDAAAAAKQSLEAVATAREAAEAREASIKRAERLRGNPAEALEGIFSRTRLGVLEEGGAKVPIFGSALEALGTSGLVAAGGLAAAALAAEQVKKAMEFADDIDKVSKSLGISTTALQEFDSAAIATSVGQDKSREALSQFNEVFNKYASGLASAKQAKFLNALGFTPESARQVTDIGDAVERSLRRLVTAIPNQGQRASLAAQLGLSNFNVVLGEGEEGVDKFIAKMKEAQTSGEVISPQQIARAAEMNDQVEALQHRIGQELKGAFIDAAPAIESVAALIERCVHGITQFLHQAPDFAVGLADVEKRAARHLAGQDGAADQQRGPAPQAPPLGFGLGPLPLLFGLIRGGVAAISQRGRQVREAQQAAEAKPDEKPTDRRIVDLSRFNAKAGGSKAAPADQTATFDAAAANAELSSQRELTTARKELAATVRRLTEASTSEGRYAAAVANADAEALAKQDDIDASLKEKLTKLDEQIAKAQAAADKGVDADAAHQIARLKAAKAAEEQAASTRRITVAEEQTAARVQAARERDLAEIDQAYDLLKGTNDFVTALHAIQGGYARSSQDRRTVELTALDDRKQGEDIERARARAKELREDLGKKDAPAAIQTTNAKFDLQQERADQLHGEDRKKAIYDTASPLERFRQEGVKTAGDVRDAFEDIATHGLDQLNDGLADAIVNGKSLGSVFKSVFASMEADLVRYLVKQAEIAAFGGDKGGPNIFSLLGSAFGVKPAVQHFATGGVVRGVGGPTSDNIPALLSPGEVVLSNSTLAGLRGLDPAQLSRGGGDVTHHISIDLSGANGDAAIAAAARAAAYQGARTAIAHTDARFDRAARRQRYSRPL